MSAVTAMLLVEAGAQSCPVAPTPLLGSHLLLFRLYPQAWASLCLQFQKMARNQGRFGDPRTTRGTPSYGYERLTGQL